MGKSRKDYEKFLNSISPDRDDEAWIIGGKNRYCGRENYGTMIKRYDPIGFNIEKRRVEAHKAKMAAKCAEICERYDKKIRQAEAEKKIMLCVFDYGLSTDNVIYYSHTNTLSFNWNGYGEKITQEEFDDFVNKVDRSQLPEGIKFELK